MKKQKLLSKHKILMRLIAISDDQGISFYYNDPVLSKLPSIYLQEQLLLLASEGYLKKNIRHTVLLLKGYEYPSTHRNAMIWKVITVTARPVSVFLGWLAGILSSLLVALLIDFINRQP